ncbi:unnamed protein product [Aureobasidium uvarum]|uniref:Uncharacterized protein n=1 Tax=Aureobasidium uvarum TaxID=2773716 RepID=A0A9N8PWN2_9PEZI|nr:unnamed protein product [Aureobasidium uvarum]
MSDEKTATNQQLEQTERLEAQIKSADMV